MDKIALMLIDIQKDFCEDTSVGSRKNRKIIPYVIKLLKKSREKGIPIIHIRWMTHKNASTMPVKRVKTKETDWCMDKEGAGPAVKELEVEDGEYLVLKSTYSGFYDTDLDALLKKLGVKTLILAGLSTHVCVLATAFDATYRGYRIIVPRECVSSKRKVSYEEALRNIDKNIGDVLSLEQVLGMI
jgi:ureidoacrylate peracid hydrolase